LVKEHPIGMIAELKVNSTNNGQGQRQGACNGRTRLAVRRSRSGRGGSPDRSRPASRTDRRGASRTCWCRACLTGARATAAGGADPAVGPAGLSGLPRVRVSRADPPQASASRTRPRRRIPHPLEAAGGLSIDRAELFGAALEGGQRDRSWTPRRRGTERTGNRASAGGGTTCVRDCSSISAGDPASGLAAEAHAGDVDTHSCGRTVREDVGSAVTDQADRPCPPQLVGGFLRKPWGSDFIVVHGGIIEAPELPALPTTAAKAWPAVGCSARSRSGSRSTLWPPDWA
jgi:hypothetical protein